MKCRVTRSEDGTRLYGPAKDIKLEKRDAIMYVIHHGREIAALKVGESCEFEEKDDAMRLSPLHAMAVLLLVAAAGFAAGQRWQ